jgi:hypothetical protein
MTGATQNDSGLPKDLPADVQQAECVESQVAHREEVSHARYETSLSLLGGAASNRLRRSAARGLSVFATP